MAFARVLGQLWARARCRRFYCLVVSDESKKPLQPSRKLACFSRPEVVKQASKRQTSNTGVLGCACLGTLETYVSIACEFHSLALAHLSRNSFGNLTPRKKPRFRKFPGKSDLRRRVGWVQYAPTRRSRSVSYVSPFGTFRHFDAQAVSLVGLRAPPAIRQRGMSSLFGEQQISTLADAIRAALMLRYNDRMVG